MLVIPIIDIKSANIDNYNKLQEFLSRLYPEQAQKVGMMPNFVIKYTTFYVGYHKNPP